MRAEGEGGVLMRGEGLPWRGMVVLWQYYELMMLG